MGRRSPPRRRLAVKRETLRRLTSLSPAELGRAVGGTIDTEATAFCTVNFGDDKYRPDRQGRTNSKHCLSGDN